MAEIYKSQTDFSGGEISPRLSGRSDSERYQTGLDKCDNFTVTPQGSLLMRDGSKYIGQASSSEDVRLIPFQRANKEDYVVEISAPIAPDAGQLRVWTREGQVDFTNVKNNLIQNGKFTNGADGLDAWDTDGNWWNRLVPVYGKSNLKHRGARPNVVWDGWAELTSVAYTADGDDSEYRRSTSIIRQKFAVPAGVTEMELKFTSKRLVIRVEQGYVTNNTVDERFHTKWHVGTTTGSRYVNYEYSVGTAEGLKDLHNTVYIEDEGSDPSIPLEQAPDYEGLGVKTVLIDTTGLTEIWLQFESRVQYKTQTSNFNRGYFLDGIAVGEISLVDTNIIEDGIFEVDHPWLQEDLAGIQYAHETAVERVILASSSQAPQEIRLDDITGQWDFAPVPIISEPPEWGPDNYPAVVEIFQSRLWFASLKDDLARVWASKVGLLDDFGTSDPLVDSDAIDIKVAARGVIQWMRGMSSTLLLGTDEGEHFVTSSTGAISPLDVHVNPASNNGSAFIQAEPVSDEVLYISNDRRKLRAISFTDDRKNWTSIDLTFPAEHISLEKIKRVINLKNPNYQLALLLDNGGWIQCTYNRGTQTLAWHSHSSTPDKVKSITGVTSNDGSILWLAIQRSVEIDSVLVNRINLEIVEAQNVYRVNMDSWVSRVANDPDGIIEDNGEYFAVGLEHLDGREVFLSEDGGNAGLHTVENGRIQVSSALVKEAIIGLIFTATAKLLPVEAGNPNDSIQSAKQRRVDLTLRLVDSAIPRVNGVLPPVRGGASIMDDKEPNLTDDIKYLVTKWGRGSSIEITQELPYRTEIVAVFGKTKTNRM